MAAPMTSVQYPPQSVCSVDEVDDCDRTITLLEMESLIDNMCQSVNQFNTMVHHLNDNDLTYGKEIAKGSRGSVYEMSFEMNGLKVKGAAKKFYKNNFGNVSNVLSTVKLQILQQNPIIPTTARVLGVTACPEPYHNPSSSLLQRSRETNDGPQLIVIYELGVCNLLQLYEQEQVPMHVTLDLFSKLAGIVHLLHGARIIHRDIKPQNIIVMNYSRGLDGLITKIDCRFTDLGLSLEEFMDDIISPNGDIGTGGFHAPEILDQQAYNFKSDIFMLGVTFCLLIQAPKMLKSNGAERLLRYMHEVKVCRRLGRSMYEATVERELMQWNYNMVPPKVKDIICEMIEIKELRRISLQTISYLCSKHRDTCLELEASKRLIGVKPLCPIISRDEQLRIEEAVDKEKFEMDALRALKTIESSTAYKIEKKKLEEAESDTDSLFNPEECLQLQQAMLSATNHVPCIATNTFRDDCKQQVKNNDQKILWRDTYKVNTISQNVPNSRKRTRDEDDDRDGLDDQPSSSKLYRPVIIPVASQLSSDALNIKDQPSSSNLYRPVIPVASQLTCDDLNSQAQNGLDDQPSTSKKYKPIIIPAPSQLSSDDLNIKVQNVPETRKRSWEVEDLTAGLDDQPSTSKLYKPITITAPSQLSSDDLNLKGIVPETRKRSWEGDDLTGLDDQPSTSKLYKPASITAVSYLSSDDLNSESTYMLVDEPKSNIKKVKPRKSTRKLVNLQDPPENKKSNKSKSRNKVRSKKELNLRTSNKKIIKAPKKKASKKNVKKKSM